MIHLINILLVFLCLHFWFLYCCRFVVAHHVLRSALTKQIEPNLKTFFEYRDRTWASHIKLSTVSSRLLKTWKKHWVFFALVWALLIYKQELWISETDCPTNGTLKRLSEDIIYFQSNKVACTLLRISECPNGNKKIHSLRRRSIVSVEV